MFASLKLAPKFALPAVIFLVLIVVALGVLVADRNTQIDFTTQQARGARYLRGVAEIHGSAALASLGHQGAQADWRGKVDQLQSRFGRALQTNVQAEAAMQSMSNDADLSTMRAKLRDLIVRIGDRSNLILDQQLDSYDMADIVLNRLPDLMDRVVVTAEMQNNSSASQQGASFLIATAALAETVDGLSASLGSAFDTNADGSLKSALGTEWGGLHDQIAHFTEALHTGEASTAMAASLLGRLQLFDEHACAELTRLLDRRVDSLEAGQWRNAGVNAVLFGLAALVMFVVARAMIIRPLSQLAAATRYLANGEHDTLLEHRNMHDALGELSQALSGFRDALLRNRTLEAARASAFAEQRSRQQELEALARDFAQTVSNQPGLQSTDIVASAAEELAASYREIAALMERSTATTEELLGRAARAHKLVDELTDVVVGTGQVIDLINTVAGQTKRPAVQTLVAKQAA